MNFGSYLTRGNTLPKANGFTSTGVFNTSITSNTGESSPIKRVMAYTLAIIIVVFIILLFVHWFIYPIFRLHPGGSGIIPVPGGDDGVLFWKNGNTGKIPNSALPIQTISAGYTMIMDMFIVNPLQFSKHPRLLFSRGAMVKARPSGDLLLGVLDNYNLAVALLPDTNDMIVSVLNKDNNMENVIVSNAPIQEAFRLGIVVMDQALEVYINGHLLKTRAFDSPPKSVTGDVYPASGIEANIAKIRNFKVWARVLPTPEIREATPAPATGKDFDAGAMPSSTSCAPQDMDSLLQMTGADKILDRVNTAMA